MSRASIDYSEAAKFAGPLTEGQRDRVHVDQAHAMHKWVEQQAWNLCDDITGRGCSTLERLSDEEMAARARGVRNTLESILERFDAGGGELRLQTLIDGAFGERYQRKHGERGTGYKRRLFGNIAKEIRAHRIAILDRYETSDYPLWESWRKRVWAIERKGVDREQWEEFQRLQHELEALRSLSCWLLHSEHWRNQNWEWRKTQEVKAAA